MRRWGRGEGGWETDEAKQESDIDVAWAEIKLH